ncbi:hypothetical protein CFP56_021842 [Quercus suber]|uniref:Uncharacterized protein n=1 Tax=Quercus suber TaxID=58331 RepID=A0AAW0KC79_QUESU
MIIGVIAIANTAYFLWRWMAKTKESNENKRRREFTVAIGRIYRVEKSQSESTPIKIMYSGALRDEKI